MFGKSCAIVVVMVVGGCGTVIYGPGTDEKVLTPASFDGKWKLTGSPGKNNGGCLTVQGGKITVADQGCAGNFVAITNSEVAVISGNEVTWVLEGTSNGTTSVCTFNMTTQPDGSLQGSFTCSGGGTRRLGYVGQNVVAASGRASRGGLTG